MVLACLISLIRTYGKLLDDWEVFGSVGQVGRVLTLSIFFIEYFIKKILRKNSDFIQFQTFFTLPLILILYFGNQLFLLSYLVLFCKYQTKVLIIKGTEK